MAKISISALKLLFKNGLKPPQESFWNIFDSFLHIDDYTPPTVGNQAQSEAAATTTPITDVSNTLYASLRSVRYLIEKWFTANKRWEIYFSAVWDEIVMLTEVTTVFTSIVKGHATTVQYSTDGGLNWVTYTTSVSLSAGSIRWRVSDFGSYSDGTIIIKGHE